MDKALKTAKQEHWKAVEYGEPHKKRAKGNVHRRHRRRTREVLRTHKMEG